MVEEDLMVEVEEDSEEELVVEAVAGLVVDLEEVEVDLVGQI